ncbi:acyl-CoA carboxylase epsilon subunit [Streptomyces maremycinicus]|uniref:acyl-CoA carboxylase epsilon subunit n=1 Tax=Streptomyces maremycinicus TaxID=1679753 RepID=UPI0007892617|nr:acyl-CoA carboxylase epsilon subunit [Streptomyces sp. NBRC 110468]
MGGELAQDTVVRVSGGGVTETEVAAVVAVVASLLAARRADVDEGRVGGVSEWRGLGGSSGYRSPRSWR